MMVSCSDMLVSSYEFVLASEARQDNRRDDTMEIETLRILIHIPLNPCHIE